MASVASSTIRRWEGEGLVQPRRSAGRHRLYSLEDVDRLRQIDYLRRFRGLNAAAIRLQLGPVNPAEPDIDPSLGPLLRAVRMRLGLSLGEAAAKSRLSISFLSAVERNRSGIGLGNLFKLADAYGTTVPGLQEAVRDNRDAVSGASYVADHGRVVITDMITEPSALEVQRIQVAPVAVVRMSTRTLAKSLSTFWMASWRFGSMSESTAS